MKRLNYLWIVFLIVILYLLGVGSIFLFQKFIIFHPVKLPLDYHFQFESPFEEMFLTTPDSQTINALYFRSEDSIRGVVLYFHGNSDNLQRWGAFHKDFTVRGYDFFAIDYRGFGKSTGQIDEQLFYKDAQLAYSWVRERYAAGDIVIYGRSLGSAMATQLASRMPARMLILETPFDNIENVILARMPALVLPFDLEYEFPNDKNIQKVSCPVYIIQGTKDKIVPYYIASRLKKYLKPNDVFYTIEGGNHKNLNNFEAYHQFLDSIIRPTGRQ